MMATYAQAGLAIAQNERNELIQKNNSSSK